MFLLTCHKGFYIGVKICVKQVPSASGGSRIFQKVEPTYFFGHFLPKTAWNWKENPTQTTPPSPTLPNGSANESQSYQGCHRLQGLSVPFACVGSGDPVRVLRPYTTNTLDVLLKHLLLRHMYNLPLPILLCYAQALCSETSYCYCDRVTPSACVSRDPVPLSVCVSVCHTVLCGALYTACVDASGTVFWDRSVLR